MTNHTPISKVSRPDVVGRVLWGQPRFAFGSTLQKLLPAMDLNSAFQLTIELVKAAPQNFNLVLIESGHEFFLNAHYELLDIAVNPSASRREGETGATPIFLVHVAPDQSPPNQQLNRSRHLESIG